MDFDFDTALIPNGSTRLQRCWGRGTTVARDRARAGVTQLAECLLPKQDVVGSNPIARSKHRTGA